MKKIKLVLAGIAILMLAIWLPNQKITGCSKAAQQEQVLVQHASECDADGHQCSSSICTPLSLSY